MKRSSFLKSLFTLAVAPKIIAEINFDKLVAKNVAQVSVSANAKLISELNLIIPEYYNQLIHKYGNENYEMVRQILGGAKEYQKIQ